MNKKREEKGEVGHCCWEAHQRWWDLWKIYSTHQENPRCDPPSHILLFFSSSFLLHSSSSSSSCFFFSSSAQCFTSTCIVHTCTSRRLHSSRPLYNNNDCPLVWILWRWIDIKLQRVGRVAWPSYYYEIPIRLALDVCFLLSLSYPQKTTPPTARNDYIVRISGWLIK